MDDCELPRESDDKLSPGHHVYPRWAWCLYEEGAGEHTLTIDDSASIVDRSPGALVGKAAVVWIELCSMEMIGSIQDL